MKNKELRIEILKAAFQRAKSQNSAFSMRSLAAKMKVSPAFVSKIFNGKVDLPLERIESLVRFLKMDKISETRLLETYIDEKVKKIAMIREKKGGFSKYEEMGDKDFQLLEHWYLIPILDFFSTTGASADPEVLAKRFGIKTTVAKQAIEFLVSKGYLIKNRQGRWEKKSYNLRFPTERSRELIRNYHSQMMQKAESVMKTQLEQHQFDRRLINGISIAANSKNVDRAIKKLNEAMYEIADILRDEGQENWECDEVYQLNIQLFPLTHPSAVQTG